MYEYEHYDQEKGISRTSTGIVLLIIGLVMSWIPYILYLGAFLSFVGAILVILGRDAFGGGHGRNVVIALVLYIIATLAVLIAAAAFIGSLPSIIGSAATIKGAFASYLIELIVFSGLASIAQVLLVYALSDSLGKKILIIAFILQIVVSVVVFAIVNSSLSHAIDLFESTNNASYISAVVNKINIYKLFNAIPAITFAVAYYMARTRIEYGEIPKSTMS